MSLVHPRAQAPGCPGTGQSLHWERVSFAICQKPCFVLCSWAVASVLPPSFQSSPQSSVGLALCMWAQTERLLMGCPDHAGREARSRVRGEHRLPCPHGAVSYLSRGGGGWQESCVVFSGPSDCPSPFGPPGLLSASQGAPPALLLLGSKRGFYLGVQELARRPSSQQHLAHRTQHPPAPTGMTEKDSGTGLSPSLQPPHPNPA